MDREQARKIIDTFASCRVAVVGDLILDRYIWGTAERISAEAPVPVVRVSDETAAPGGAANVLANAAALGAVAVAFGVVGADADADAVTTLCRDRGIDTAGIVVDPDRPTTVKTRVLANNQQVVRVDRECDHAISESIQDRILAGLRAAFKAGLGAVIIEDYNKGVVSERLVTKVLELGAAHDVPVALDPHPGHPLAVPGLAVMTPNRAEAFALAGAYLTPTVLPLEDDAELIKVSESIFEQCRPRLLLITLGGDGIALFEENTAPRHIATAAREVFDVSGAGDTTAAVFVLALAAGAAPVDAAVLANHAAGVVVSHVGTATVDAATLLAAVE